MYQMTLRKISACWVGCTKITDDRQMDGSQHIANVNAKIKKRLELKMFYQTYTTRKASKFRSPCTPVTPGSDRMVPSAAAHHLKHTARVTVHCQWEWRSSFPVFVPDDLWPWHSNSSERGIKRIFPVNLAQIRSAVPEIFHIQTNKKVTDSAKNRTLLACSKESWCIICNCGTW